MRHTSPSLLCSGTSLSTQHQTSCFPPVPPEAAHADRRPVRLTRAHLPFKMPCHVMVVLASLRMYQHPCDRPVHGLIFLFKWRPEKDDRRTEPPDQGSVYFARQIITNACATQAIIGILFNSPAISLGQELTAFRDFTADLPPDLKGKPELGRRKVYENAMTACASPASHRDSGSKPLRGPEGW